MHYRLARMGTVGLIVAILFGLNAWLFQTPAFAQEDGPEIPVGDFRLLVKETFILEQIETQLAPFVEDLAAYGLTLSDPSVDFRDNNRIDVSATTELPLGNSMITVRPTVTMAITAANNQMSIAIEGVTLEGVALPPAMLGTRLEVFQEQAQDQINQGLLAVERYVGIELAYIGTTEDLLILDFNFDLLFYDIGQGGESSDS